MADHLFHNVLSVGIVLRKDLGPDILGLTFHEVTGLESIEGVLIGDVDELIITLAPGPLVRGEGQMGVPVLAIMADLFRIVERIVDQELLRVLIGVDFDLGQGIVDGGELIPLCHAGIQPVLQHSETVAFFKFFNQLVHGAVASQIVQNLFNVIFITFHVDQGAQHHRRGIGVVLQNVNFNKSVEIVLVQVADELINEPMLVAQDQKRDGVGEFNGFQEILDLYRVVAVLFVSDDAFHLLELVDLHGTFNVLEVEFRVLGILQNSPQKVEQSVEGRYGFKDLDAGF